MPAFALDDFQIDADLAFVLKQVGQLADSQSVPQG